MRRKQVTALIALVLAAAVTALTLTFRIPVPSTGGYLNLGDIVIIFSSLFFGPAVGLAVGAAGSAAADVLGGYAAFAPVTLIVKGLEGLVPGLMTRRASSSRPRAAAGASLGALTMVVGYFIGESLMPSIGVEAALGEVPGNVFQAIAGALGGYGLFFSVEAAFGAKGGSTP